MLVAPDGRQWGTLGGGCVEAEVKRRALGVLERGRAEISHFQLDSDYGWDDGLICGGRMHVLIDPVADAASQAYYESLASMAEENRTTLETVVFDGEQSGLPETSCFLFDEDRQLVARLRGDEKMAHSLADSLPDLAKRPQASAIRGVAYLPRLRRCRLVIVGGGHVGQALGELAADLDFDVWVVDDRAEYANPNRFPKAERHIVGPIDEVLPQLEITGDTYCVIVTRGHNHDQEALYHLVDRGARYIGLIGSRRKIRMIFDNLVAEGVASSALERVFAPLGIDIGSQTVMEIAVSIAAELVAHRNRSGLVPGRPEAVAVATDS
jgi:xanthine dehydrogenase accessory factor